MVLIKLAQASFVSRCQKPRAATGHSLEGRLPCAINSLILASPGSLEPLLDGGGTSMPLARTYGDYRR